MLARAEAVRVEAPRMMWHITVGRLGAGRRNMVSRTVGAVGHPSGRVMACRVVGVLTHIR